MLPLGATARSAKGAPMTDAEYHRLTGALLARIEATIDRWLQEGVVDIDGQRTGGLLELDLPDASKIVVNTQPPLHEVWLATRDGGYHFRYVDGQWLDTRDAAEFFTRLSAAASAQAGQPLSF